jgi:hypothetical protein
MNKFRMLIFAAGFLVYDGVAAQTNAPASSPGPSASPGSSAHPSATATTASASPTPSSTAAEERMRVGGPLKSQARKFNPSHVEPMPSPGAQTGASPTDAASAPPVRPRPEGLRRRTPPQASPGVSAASTSPSVTPSPAATTSPTGSP